MPGSPRTRRGGNLVPPLRASLWVWIWCCASGSIFSGIKRRPFLGFLLCARVPCVFRPKGARGKPWLGLQCPVDVPQHPSKRASTCPPMSNNLSRRFPEGFNVLEGFLPEAFELTAGSPHIYHLLARRGRPELQVLP